MEENISVFLKEEFRENWVYIRHIEELRLKHLHAYIAIIGVLISLSSLLINHSKGLLNIPIKLDSLMTKCGIVIGIINAFIFLYGYTLCIFLVKQKRNYNHYMTVNEEIRDWFIKKYEENYKFSFYIPPPADEKNKGNFSYGTFIWWLLLIFIIDISSLFILSVTIFYPIHCVYCWSAFVVLSFTLFNILWFFIYKEKKQGKKGSDTVLNVNP